MTIKPVHNDADNAGAIARIEMLWGSSPGTPEGDELDVLATLVDQYESTRWPDREIDPVDCLRIVMEDTQRSQGDLARLLGSRSRASEILNRRRALTVEMIWSISREWNIPADMLVKPYALTTAA
jgi:HTH-type transcriptional regulator / antitoxin HigA